MRLNKNQILRVVRKAFNEGINHGLDEKKRIDKIPVKSKRNFELYMLKNESLMISIDKVKEWIKLEYL